MLNISAMILSYCARIYLQAYLQLQTAFCSLVCCGCEHRQVWVRCSDALMDTPPGAKGCNGAGLDSHIEWV